MAQLQHKEAEILKVMLPVFVLIICLVIIKKFFSGAFSGIGESLQGVGEAGGIGEKVGVFKNATEKAQEQTLTVKINNYNSKPSTNCFLPSYHKELKKQGNISTSTHSYASAIAEQIEDANGFFGYNPGQLVGAFQKLKTKAAVSFMADVYSSKYSSLWNDLLNDWYNTSSRKEAALLEVFRYVESLPKGVISKTGKIT